MKLSRTFRGIVLALCMVLLVGCAQTEVTAEPDAETGSAAVYVDETIMEAVDLEDEAVALAEAPAPLPAILETVASGEKEKRSDKAVIDYSNTADGYVMAQYTAQTTKRLKVQVKGPVTTYTYNLPQGQWTAFPLSDGNGSYQVTIYENVTGTKYAMVLSVTQTVTLADEFAPFLRPNQYVDYTAASAAVAKAAELTKDMTDPLEKVEAVYDFVVKSLTYDKEKAAAVKTGYLPVLDEVLKAKKGICFDYASLMTGMLRSQGVPCKLVVGYAGTAYHAWLNVWTEESGWVDGVIYFDGQAWQRMDPTFASSGKQSASIMAYIGDGSHYTVKYLY